METKKEKSTKVQELMEMSKTLYDMHEKLNEFEAPVTGLRQDILKVCSGLDSLRNQIVSGTDKIATPTVTLD